MRLFGVVDGTVDRLDRAGWMTPPFDLAFAPSFDLAIPTVFDSDFEVSGGDPDETSALVPWPGEPDGIGDFEALASEPDDTSTFREL